MTALARRVAPLRLPIPAPWLPVDQVAARLGVTDRRVRQLCDDPWSAAGLARRFDSQWGVMPGADPRLADLASWDLRDTEQLATLAAGGIKPRYLDVARQRMELVRGFDAFECAAANETEQLDRYLLHCRAEGGFEIKIPSTRTFRRWRAAYRAEGMLPLVPDYDAHRDGRDPVGESAWAYFIQFKHAGTGISVSVASRLTAGEAARHADDPRWAWPGLRAVQLAYKTRVPKGARTLADKGPHKFRAQCLPKITRSFEQIPAGAHLVGDERIFDFMVRVRVDRGYKRVRLKLTAWLDLRSRRFVGWCIGQRANSDTILSAFKAACLEMGTVPEECTVDNGMDYKAVAGSNRRDRKWDEFDSSRVSTAFERLGVRVHYAIVRSPWSKMIESHFKNMKNTFDRFFASFWGGRPEDRPWDADAWCRANLETLPTEAEVRERFALWLADHHEQPQSGDGMFNLCPREAFARFRTDAPRVADEATLRYACCRMVGSDEHPLIVGRDGVRIDGIRYGRFDEAVWRMQGHKVRALVDAVRADEITICDAHGVPICVARADAISGATRDDVRAAARARARMTRVAREYESEGRAILIRTAEQNINQQRAAAQRSDRPVSEHVAQASAAPEPDTLRLVRPDIAAGAERVRRAAGADAISRLSDNNAAAQEINRRRGREVDWAAIGRAARQDEPQRPPCRSVDWAALGAPPDRAANEISAASPRIVDAPPEDADGAG